MRIAYFTETFIPKVDGVSVKVKHLLDYLAEHDHESIIFSPRYPGIPDQYQKTRVYPRPGLVVPFYPELKMANPYTNVVNDLREFKPDLVHIVNPVSMGLAGLWGARKLGVPVIASYHTDVPGFARRWGLGMFYETIYGFFRWLHNQCDLNVAPSQVTVDELIEHGFERVQVWPGGVDITKFNPAKRSNIWRERLTDGNPTMPLILWVSRLAPEKRPDMLLKVIREIPGVRLAIIGDGPYRAELEKKFAGTPTVFMGYLQGEDLAAAYAAGDIFIHTGANETFGNVVIEAMASGLPIVAPHSGGLLDFVKHGENGFLYDTEDNQSLVTLVRDLVNDEAARWRFGLHGREVAESRSWTIILANLMKTYQEVIDNYKNSNAHSSKTTAAPEKSEFLADEEAIKL